MSKKSVVNEIHRNVRKTFPRRHVTMKDIDDLWQADLIDMQAFSKENKNYKYILIVIDVFSKYAWAYPIQQKSKEHVTNAFKSLLEKGRIPKNLQTDLGKEFYNSKLKKILMKHGINHYSTYSTMKASIAERFIRTIKSKLYKQFSLQGNYRWHDVILAKLINEYNSTIHKTIGIAPNEVTQNNKRILLKRYAMLQTSGKSCKQKFRVGDFVRISKYKGIFEKGYTPNWSTEIFKVIKVQPTKPITYLLEDSRRRPILGSFYTQELQKTNCPDIYLIEKVLKRKGNKLFVKWLGLSEDENSWINDSNVL